MKTGEKVAVKVQHNWLQEECYIDIFVVELIATIGKKLFEDFDYDFMITDMKKNVPQELDFRIEANNAMKTAEYFKNDIRIKVPSIYQDFSNVGESKPSRRFLPWSL